MCVCLCACICVCVWVIIHIKAHGEAQTHSEFDHDPARAASRRRCKYHNPDNKTQVYGIDEALMNDNECAYKHINDPF